MNISELMIPSDIQEALSYLRRPGAMALSAGTDLLPALREGVLSGVTLVDLHKLSSALSSILETEGGLFLGAMATHAEIAKNPLIQAQIPMLGAACNLVGSAQIRNRATIGGNIMNASPAADSVPVLVAADAQAVFLTGEGERRMLLSDFLVAPRKTKLPQGGLLTAVYIPVPKGGYAGGYYKVGGRTSLTIAIVSCALLSGGPGDLRAAFGSMSPSVKRINFLEHFLLANPGAGQEQILNAVSSVLSPISDIRAGAEYRLRVAANLLWQAQYELQTGRGEQ